MLWRYRQAVGGTRTGPLIVLVAIAYFFVWTIIGMAAFPLGSALAEITMQQPAMARAVPMVTGLVVLLAGS
jgi:predicted metal-binding membrane protein